MNPVRMAKRTWAALFLLPVTVLAQTASAPDYATEVQPVFDRYCVACHACYDAPCQLDLTQPSGILRGASKKPVYDGTRLREVAPSRLDIDATGESAWRERGFHSVLGGGQAPSLLLALIGQKAAHPLQAGAPLPKELKTGIRRKNYCPAPDELPDYFRKHPHAGMPFGFPAIPQADADTLRAWVHAGAPMQKPLLQQTADEARQVRQWEDWLNGKSPEQRLVSRWLYEHLAFARLHFSSVYRGNFYRLVRSRTPAGKPVSEIATRYPNSDPGEAYYYRFRPELGTRVYKTLIRFTLNETQLQRTRELFFGTSWKAGDLPGYSAEDRANPFVTFGAIPARARYQFMLDNAHYFIRTFIRGPVCRGQIATDVIRDHFWVMFQEPDQDQYIRDAGYRRTVDKLLSLPGVDHDLLDGASAWLAAADGRNRYEELRKAQYRDHAPEGAALGDIWAGDGNNPNALLSVFRHHDSATVVRGWLGQQPLTTWWMDYPLLERAYYNLVANFDVFGSVSHQAQTRLYFDLIRNGSEQNFLRLLPASHRKPVLSRWYRGSGKLKLWLAYEKIDTQQPSAVGLRSDSPYPELLGQLLHRFAHLNQTPDPINRPVIDQLDAETALLSTLSNTPLGNMPAIRHLPDASLVRVTEGDGTQRIYTLVRNRMHTNVAFMLGESLRYQAELDELTVTRGITTGYPNFMFEVPLEDLPAFVAGLRDKANGRQAAFVRNLVETWGRRRSDPRVWNTFHAVHDFMREDEPLEAGILDLNRYIDYPES